jgi:hypothetical protein
MKTLQRQQTRRRIIHLSAEVDNELTHLAHERGRRQASLLLEACEDWLHRQEVRIEMLDDRSAKTLRPAHQESVPLATIRF